MASEVGSSGGAENRRFVRRAINLVAWISVNQQPPGQCTVKDFCAGGMFIAPDGEAPEELDSGTPAILYFALIIDGEQRDYQLNLSVARASKSGLGVAFVDPDPDALAMLDQLAAPEPVPPPPPAGGSEGDAEEAATEPSSPFVLEFDKVEEPLKEVAVEKVLEIVEAFIKKADEALFICARDARNNKEETLFLDGQTAFRKQFDRIREEVPEHIRHAITILKNPFLEGKPDARSIRLSDLSLVEKSEFEDFLLISELMSEIEPKFARPIKRLVRRFSVLNGRDIEMSALPLSPEVICSAIAESLKDLEVERQCTRLLYKVLGEVLEGQLGAFLKAVDEVLAEYGVEQKKAAPPPDKKGPASEVDAVEEDFSDLIASPEAYGLGTPAEPAAPQAPPPVPDSGINAPLGQETNDLGATGDAGQGAPPNPEPMTQAQPPLNPPPGPGGAQPPPAGYQPPANVAPPPAGYQPPANVAPPPAGYQPPPNVAPPPAGYQPPANVAPPPAGYQPPANVAPPPAGYQPPPNVAPPPAGYQPAPNVAPPPAGYQPPPNVAPPPAGYQPVPEVATPSVAVPPAGYQPPHLADQGAASAPEVATPAAVQAAEPAVVPAAVADSGALADSNVQVARPNVASAPGAFVPAAYPTSFAPPRYVAPSMPQAYSAAQAQLALRRELMPQSHATPLDASAAYTEGQVLNAFSSVQQELADDPNAGVLGVDYIKERITSALVDDGAPMKELSTAQSDAIEVVANLFGSLLEDAFVASGAKQHLTQLQPAVHRAALADSSFFESEQHPVRRVINRISQVQDAADTIGHEHHAKLGHLVAEANRQYTDDPDVFEPVLEELDAILEEQGSSYERNVANVVEAAEEQQRILQERIGEGETLGSSSTMDRTEQPEEWNKWLDRSKQLEVGQRLLFNANTRNPISVTLVFVAEEYRLFVFVDEKGNRSQSLTLQQTAMYLRRGLLKLIHQEDDFALDRALVGMVNKIHNEVEERATVDELTGFLNRKSFVQLIENDLPETETAAAQSAVLGHFTIANLKSVNEASGEEAGDALVREIAEQLKTSLTGARFGRLTGSELGIFWNRGGAEAAEKKLKACSEEMEQLVVEFEAQELKPEFFIGIASTASGLAGAEELIDAARESSEMARAMGTGSVYVATTESERLQKLEKMVSYVDRALEKGRLEIAAQEIHSASGGSGRMLHVAVAARDRNDKLIPSDVLHQALVRSNNANEIDLWAFKRSLTWLAENEELVEDCEMISIDLTTKTVKNEDTPNQLMTEFMQTPVPPGKLCFVLQDRDASDNLTEASELVTALRSFGCRFMLDEFGSGHSSYDYVKELEVDYVCIQSSFIADAARDNRDYAMAKSVNELAHFMGKKTIAKQPPGTEVDEMAKQIGIDLIRDSGETILSGGWDDEQETDAEEDQEEE